MPYGEDAPNLATEIAFWYQAFDDATYPLGDLGKVSSDLVRKFRALGIMLLLSEASTDLFLHNLHRAGRARLFYLRRAAAAGKKDEFFQAKGKYSALLSTIAAADWAAAREIDALTSPDLLPGEYEDDHCVAQIVGLLIRDTPAGDAEFTPFFDRFEAYLDGNTDARLDVLRALVARDQAEFDTAFERVLAAFTESIQAAKDRRQLEEPVTLALREVDVDALAFLRLAELRGLVTQSEYAYCPSLARAPMRVPFPRV
ncbi:MAG: Imm49 family immunity protein [Polyangiaceae bacterium]